MDSFAYHLAWAILAIQATVVLFIAVYILGRVVGFAQVLWQKYVWSKIMRGYNKDKSLMLHEDPYLGPPTQMLEKVYGRSHHTADRDVQHRTRRVVKKATKIMRKGAATGKEIEEFAGETRG
jgi:hypothetical protein